MPGWVWWVLISGGLCALSWFYGRLSRPHPLYSTRLAGALVRAHQRGIEVHVILDANAQTHYPPVKAVALLVGAGIAVSLDDQHEWAHGKVMILDGAIVITGSYNWTLAAENKNGENLLVIRDPRLAGVYTKNWRRHADHSTPYRGTVPCWAHICVEAGCGSRNARGLPRSADRPRPPAAAPGGAPGPAGLCPGGTGRRHHPPPADTFEPVPRL
jgi:phosphatidylserine/phosphatidylglycerophosphate/cardiolipin synthase-like enzyme